MNRRLCKTNDDSCDRSSDGLSMTTLDSDSTRNNLLVTIRARISSLPSHLRLRRLILRSRDVSNVFMIFALSIKLVFDQVR